MAKKSYNSEVDEIFEEQEALPVEDVVLHLTEDPLADKVLSLRAKGYDNNRIAAILGVHKQTVDKI